MICRWWFLVIAGYLLQTIGLLRRATFSSTTNEQTEHGNRKLP